MATWYSEKNNNPVVLCSVVRLIRNVADRPFSKMITFSEQEEINQAVKSIVLNSNTPYAKSMKYISIGDVPIEELYAMAERNVINEEFLREKGNKALLISEDEKVSIMLSGKDHICIQVINEGLNLTDAYNIAYEIDMLISSGIKYAFDEKLGYLTSSPSNLGTGLQTEAVLHLYALRANGSVQNIAESISKIGFRLNSMFAESIGGFYRVQNSISLGITEKSTIDNFNVLLNQISEKEILDRGTIKGIYLENNVWRAYGILKNARILSFEEIINLFSEIKIGISLGIINISEELPIKLLTECRPYMLCRKYGIKAEEELNVLRADAIRRAVPNLEE